MNKQTLAKLAIAALAVAATLVAPSSKASTLLFVPDAPIHTTVFSGATTGQNVGDAFSWTGTTTNVADTFVANPVSTGYGGQGQVIETQSADRRSVNSPSLGLSAGWNDSEYVFLSGWFLRTTTTNSGARLYIRSSDATVISGFGITDGISTPYAGGTVDRGHFMIAGSGVNFYSDEAAIANHWYEMRLVIKQDETDASLALGYLFVRDATAGDTSFRLIEDIAGVNLNYETVNLSLTDHWRVEALRAGGQIGSLAIGTGTMIPEPSTVTLTLGAALFAGVRFLRKGRSARR